MSPEVVQLCAAVYGVLCALAALNKLDSWSAWSATTETLFTHREFVIVVRFGTPIIEIGVGALALVAPTFGLTASAVLLGVFTVTALAKAPGHTGQPCNCFGALMPSRIGYSLVLRNLALLVPAALVLAFAGDERPGPLEPAAFLAVVLAGSLVLILTEFRRFIARSEEWRKEVERSG